MIQPIIKRAALLFVCGSTGLALLTGCSSTSSNESTSSNGATTSATPTKGTPTSAGAPTKMPTKAPTKAPTSGASSAAPVAGECTETSILAALPAGSTMGKDDYACAIASPAMWVAARVKPGPRVFFLQATSGAWKVSTADKVCGKPPAGLPKEILAFCPKA